MDPDLLRESLNGFFDTHLTGMALLSTRLVIGVVVGISAVMTVFKAVSLRLGPVGLIRRLAGTAVAVGVAGWVAHDPAEAITAVVVALVGLVDLALARAQQHT